MFSYLPKACVDISLNHDIHNYKILTNHFRRNILKNNYIKLHFITGKSKCYI